MENLCTALSSSVSDERNLLSRIFANVDLDKKRIVSKYVEDGKI